MASLAGRKAAIIGCIGFLLVAESAWFGRQCVAGLLWIRGERAFFRNDHREAWAAYRRALAWGGNRERLEVDQVNLLMFGLDQIEAGIRLVTPVEPAEAVRLAKDLMARRLLAAPYSAYDWSITSDVLQHADAQRRAGQPLDLDRLSENPLDNLGAERHLGIAAQKIAIGLEPNNAVYSDALALTLVDAGAPEIAAEWVRRSVAAAPVLAAHQYLDHADLPEPMLEAAVNGFEDARGAVSLVPRAYIESEAGRLLLLHGRADRARPYLERAAQLDPGSYDAHAGLGELAFGAGDYRAALEQFGQASRILAEAPWPHYYMGVSHVKLGELPAAVEAFRLARERDPREPRFVEALAEALEESGRVREAERQWLAATRLIPEDGAAWTSLLSFYQRRGDARAAAALCNDRPASGAAAEALREPCARTPGALP